MHIANDRLEETAFGRGNSENVLVQLPGVAVLAMRSPVLPQEVIFELRQGLVLVSKLKS
jgi:hypothetical protein